LIFKNILPLEGLFLYEDLNLLKKTRLKKKSVVYF